MHLKNRAKELRKKQTKYERILWQELRAKKFGYKFRRQFPVGSYIIDFFCFELMLGIEVDGEHHKDPEINKYDDRRTIHLNKKEILVLRFTNNEIYSDLEKVLTKIKKYIDKTKKL